ncbi:MEDS domain-containing protein [bacterium]|nr:MEDS domain-containing protein [bacterium]
MEKQLRESGIPVIGDVPWGTHFCQFYHTRQDLIDILVPYFKAGLENNEFCMWVTSEPLRVEDARRALKKVVKNLDTYIKKGQVEILDAGQWYTKSGRFDSSEVLQGWVEKEKQALRNGFDGLRLTGNTFWLEKRAWKDFADYEAAVNSVIGQHRMIAVCSYCLDKCSASEVIDVVSNHQFAIIRQEGEWRLIESSEHKRAEEEIRNLAKFPSENPNPVLRIAEDGAVLYSNAAGEPLLSDWDSGIGRLLPDCWRNLAAEVLKSGSGTTIEAEHRGRTFSFEIVPVADAGYVNVYAGDITERKRAEEALRLSHRFLVIANRGTEIVPLLKEFVAEIREFTACSAVGIRVLDKEGNIPYQAYEGFSEEFYELESPLSLRSDQCMCINVIKGTTDPKMPFFTEGGSFYMNGTTRFLATVSEEEKGETRNACNEFGYESVALIPICSGEQIFGLFHVADSRENMVPLKTVKMLEDAATELAAAIKRLLVEEALASERERLAVTLNSIGDGVISADPEGKAVLINEVAEELTGWTQQEVVGKPLSEIFHIINEDTRERCENPVEKVLQIGRIVGLANRTVLVARDGTERIVADSGAPILDRQGDTIGVVLVFRDITEKRKMEEELLRTEKMESVGVLAGGIAHDFNNILTLILGNISLAKTVTDAESKTFELLTRAEKASWRARDLTQQLLTFSSGGAPVRKTISLSGIIKDAAAFALSGSNVRCEFSIPDDLRPVEADEGQIGQVINNLIINADQAMPEGGVINVSAENITLDPESALPLPEGEYVKLIIQDEGIGVSPDHLPKIFDPYFSTKQKGSGLGLATAYSVIKNHDGHITVESELGGGTTFFIYLPASEKEIPKKKAARERIIIGQGRVLVMDDEEAVGQLAHDILTRCGYEVELAMDGAEAIELYREAKESGQPFDAVILDLTVPGGMGGKEAIQKLLEIDHEVRAIVSSGYSTDPIMADFTDHGFRAVVAKPYQIHELARAVHRVISAKGK